MMVTELYNRIAERILLCNAIQLNLLVEQDHLWHSGRITDRVDPITLQPTCFLASRTVVTVRIASPYPQIPRPEGPLLEQLDELDATIEVTNHHDTQPSLMMEDGELNDLYREMIRIKIEITSRWTELLVSGESTNALSRSKHDDDPDDGDRCDPEASINSPLINVSSSERDTVPSKSVTSHEHTGQQGESSDNLSEGPDSNTNPSLRRATVRQRVKRVPYVVGSGGGLAKKSSGPLIVRKPVVERWSYETIPSLMAQYTLLATTGIEEIPALSGRASERMQIHGELIHGEQNVPEKITIHGELPHGELSNGELSIDNQSSGFTQSSSLDYCFLDWVSEHHSGSFSVILEFPNAIDPDHPIGTVEDHDLVVFTNQTVPNLYLQISHLLGVFPSCFHLMILGNVLRHSGIISIGDCVSSTGEVIGKCPILTNRSVVTVIMLCTDGKMIPQGYYGLPAGFPVSYPPDGMTRSDAPGGMSIRKPISYEPQNHTAAAAEQFRREIMNAPDSDESASEDLTYDELIEAIIESTCMNTVDDWGESAVSMMVSNPGFTILGYGNGTALVLFPDLIHRVFFTNDIDDACASTLASSTKDLPTEIKDKSHNDPTWKTFPSYEQRVDHITVFNSRERYNRRLYAAEMKAVWDFDHQLTRGTIHCSEPMALDMEYGRYLDYITEKLRIYDEDYSKRLKLLKPQPDEMEQTPGDRSRMDQDSRLRQKRTEDLWKGLRRLMSHRLLLRHDISLTDPEPDLSPSEESMQWRLLNAEDKYEAAVILQPPNEVSFSTRKIFLTTKTLRRILNFKESIVKYGIFIPRNDNEADQSPERVRWASGRELEWMRLQDQGTFGRNWDWARVRKKFPQYKKSDIGHMFFVYDFKHSGEHRVRLVFDGSRQNPDTYTETYAPTSRGESVRLFHIYAVEERWVIAQYDVPQAFLKSKMDCDIFVYPPRNFAEFPNQLLKLNLSLYGAKQSAALWNHMIDQFLQELGFVPSSMDPCLYRRADAIIILFVDDLRVAATPSVLQTIYEKLYSKFQITTSDCTRFLGMDTIYDIEKGYLKLHMETYIVSIHERFHSFDLSMGVPFREIVGCLMWVCLCVMGPELLRVKDLARLSNTYTAEDFNAALKVLDRIYSRRTHGIVIIRGGAGSELVPSSTRASTPLVPVVKEHAISQMDNIGSVTEMNELREKSLYKVKDDIADEDIRPVILPINERYNLIIYSDASFAVGDTKQSVSGFVVFLNGTPLLWGSLKQTVVVDSSCSAEYVAASVACKQAIHAENIIGFLGFSCTKPYLMYTDSTACLSIATNKNTLGNVRHLAIRFNLVRCYVTIGEITMCYCITEEMIADLLTKVVAGDQDARLTIRFYNLCPTGCYYVTNHV
jgi:hypothetical protein